LTEYFN